MWRLSFPGDVASLQSQEPGSWGRRRAESEVIGKLRDPGCVASLQSHTDIEETWSDPATPLWNGGGSEALFPAPPTRHTGVNDLSPWGPGRGPASVQPSGVSRILSLGSAVTSRVPQVPSEIWSSTQVAHPEVQGRCPAHPTLHTRLPRLLAPSGKRRRLGQGRAGKGWCKRCGGAGAWGVVSPTARP